MTGATAELHGRVDRRARWRTIIACTATALICGTLGWAARDLGRQATVEQQRAETAVQGAEQLCEQVQQLGGTCAVDPASLRGERGEPGPKGDKGDPPTDAQVLDAVTAYFRRNPPGSSPADIAAAVARYLTANPPAPGPAGAPGQNATPEQVANAVRAYLTANPPPAGPKGDQGSQGERGERGAQGPGATAEQIATAVEDYVRRNPLPACPAGTEQQTITVVTSTGAREIVACTQTEQRFR